MKQWLVRLYPKAWRRRYGAEFEALLEQQALSLGAVVDILRGALDAHLTVGQHGRAPVQAGRAYGEEGNMKSRYGPYACSFCGKSQEAVRRLIAGPGVSICDECITLCNQIIAEEEQMSPTAHGGQPGGTENEPDCPLVAATPAPPRRKASRIHADKPQLAGTPRLD